MNDTAVHHEFRSIHALAEECHARAKCSALPPQDARNNFFLQVGNQLIVYAASLGFEITASKFIGRPTGDDVVDLMVKILGTPIEYSTLHAYSRTDTLDYIRQKHRRLLYLDTWCAFEHALRSIYRALVPPADQAADRRGTAPVSVYKIWKRLVTLATPAAELERHWITVDFCAAARNTIHSNTLYEGDKKRLELTEHRSILLVPGHVTDFHTEVDLPLLIQRLVAVAEGLRSTLIAFEQLIPTLTAGKEPSYG